MQKKKRHALRLSLVLSFIVMQSPFAYGGSYGGGASYRCLPETAYFARPPSLVGLQPSADDTINDVSMPPPAIRGIGAGEQEWVGLTPQEWSSLKATRAYNKFCGDNPVLWRFLPGDFGTFDSSVAMVSPALVTPISIPRPQGPRIVAAAPFEPEIPGIMAPQPESSPSSGFGIRGLVEPKVADLIAKHKALVEGLAQDDVASLRFGAEDAFRRDDIGVFVDDIPFDDASFVKKALFTHKYAVTVRVVEPIGAVKIAQTVEKRAFRRALLEGLDPSDPGFRDAYAAIEQRVIGKMGSAYGFEPPIYESGKSPYILRPHLSAGRLAPQDSFPLGTHHPYLHAFQQLHVTKYLQRIDGRGAFLSGPDYYRLFGDLGTPRFEYTRSGRPTFEMTPWLLEYDYQSKRETQMILQSTIYSGGPYPR